MRVLTQVAAGLLATAVALAPACNGGTKTSGPSGVPSQNGQPGAGDTVEQANVEQAIKKHVAKQMSVPAGEVEVTILADADVPGLAVFSTYIAPPQTGRPGRHVYGVAAGSTVETDRAAAQKMVLDAWSYGPERTVPAIKVARVLGLFEGKSREPAEPILIQAHIDAMSESQKKVLFLPKEATIDGQPAVQYWNTSGEVPLWLTTAIIGPDRAVTIRKEEHWD